jgi:hypothetical protein
MRAMLVAMVILMVPAFLILAGLTVMAFRKRKPPS